MKNECINLDYKDQYIFRNLQKKAVNCLNVSNLSGEL